MEVRFICELCQNHNGDFRLVEKMVHELADTPVTHIKLQHIYADRLSYRPQFEAGCLNSDGAEIVIKRPYRPEYERLKNLELTYDQNKKFIQLVESVGKIPLTTCFTHQDVDAIRDLGYRQIKIASYDCGSEALLRRIRGNFEHYFISTGASYDDEIRRAIEIFSGLSASFLHCVTIYPTPMDKLNLGKINYLASLWSPEEVGFSDHTDAQDNSIWALKLAFCLGARVFERHYRVLGPTDSRDGRVSISRTQLMEFFEFVSMDETAQENQVLKYMHDFKQRATNPDLKLTSEELLNRNYYRGRFASSRGDRGPRDAVMNWELW